MDAQKIIDSGKFNLHTIEDVVLLSDRTDRINLEIKAKELSDSYFKIFTVGFDTDDETGQGILEFLSGDETSITLSEVVNRLIGKGYFEIDIDKVKSGPKIDGIDYESTGYLKFKHPFSHQGIYDGTRVASLGFDSELIEYVPVMPFYNFSQEKEFRKKYGRNRNWAWGEESFLGSIEHDIRKVVAALNGLDFTYTSGWSHSGTPNDHGGPGSRFASDNFTLDSLKNTTWVPAPDHAGYIIFRADQTNANYNKFLSDLIHLPGVEIKQIDNGNSILIVKIDDSTLKSGNIGNYQKNMEAKWDSVLGIIKDYSNKF